MCDINEWDEVPDHEYEERMNLGISYQENEEEGDF